MIAVDRLTLALHIPDGFIDARTSVAAAVIAVTLIAHALRQSRDTLDERQIPLAGLVAAFVFAAQLVNFPVAGGTSGHLVGGVLAAVLVGPWVGALCVAVVLIVQALVFADGGLSALGLNVVIMAFVSTLGGYAAFRVFTAALPDRKGSVVVAGGVAAGLGVLLAALAFTAAYAVGGTGGASVATVAVAMIGVHALIGIGEGIITAFTLAAVIESRPDLVWGARHLARSPSTPQVERAR